MPLLKKHGAGALVGLIVGGGAAYGATSGIDQANIDDANADKISVYSQYVYASARLGETPTLDISVATPEEATKAYLQAVQNTKAEKTQNLLDGLKAKAVLDKVACKVPPEKVLIPAPVEPVPDTP